MYQKQKTEIITLLRALFNQLENACKGKLSTNDITSDRLLWEIYNKIFTILITCENCIFSKDSLTSHLIARYTYEMLIVFSYIFTDKTKTYERMEKFLTFSQFKSENRKWTDKTLSDMVEEIPEKYRFSSHKDHYKRLSNFAHPSMDSFLLNRRGEKSEFLMILNTTLLTIATILEIIKISFEQNLQFDEEQKKKINLTFLSSTADKLMKELMI